MARHAQNPLVSICIPVYNNPNGLKRVLDSIAIQSCTDYEVIVTDDSTSLDARALCAKYKGRLPHLKYIKNQQRAGSPENWNLAVELAKGKYIKIVHHDDWFTEPNSLHEFTDLAERHGSEPVFIFCTSTAIDPRGKQIGVNAPAQREVDAFIRRPERLLDANIIGAPSATMFTNTKGLRFDKRLVWLVDVDFYVQLIKKGFTVKYISEPLIATTAASPKQVTSSVQNDLTIELFENAYVYEKWFARSLLRSHHAERLRFILAKYEVNSVDGIAGIQTSGFTAVEIRLIIWLRKMKKTFITK